MLVAERPLVQPRERPILFQGPMVRPILADTKLQTRRAMKPQPGPGAQGCYRRPDALFIWTSHPRENNGPGPGVGISEPFRCPYGVPGDRLWGREAWRANEAYDAFAPREIGSDDGGEFEPGGVPIHYEANGPAPARFGKLRPSMFMPRWASRLQLEIVDVRVERLQDISEADAIAEGIEPIPDTGPGAGPNKYSVRVEGGWWNFPTAVETYRALWESINGAGSWNANPWVWAVTFRRIPACLP